ncbi:MAG: HAD-IC family P-type ATPase [Candidatus Sericytochromatia bacterium]|nr:HAD-IC family P-type ATPase [Candidatus Sericytochromatia bacterium]
MPERGTPWHAERSEAVEARLGGGPAGLASTEAAARLTRHGPNRLPEPRRRGPLRRLAMQFHNPLIYVLLASSVVSGVLSHWVDAGVILAVVVLNAVVGFLQEGRAERSLEAIRRMIDPRAAVVRDGRRVSVPAEALVPGDRVLLEPGDRVPADLRLVAAEHLRVDEAALTGESQAVLKGGGPLAADTPLADRVNMAWSGTMVVAGRGVGLVVATGDGTELGRISRLLRSVEGLQTPLTRQLDGFARQITAVILVASLALFVLAVWGRGYAADEAFLMVVGLAVAAIPEGLPAVVTITLAVGVGRMAARHALIRHLPAVEALGGVAIVCSDKTGTLTRNEMMVQAVVTPEGEVAVSGEGYAPDGAFAPDQPSEALVALARVALLCNDAEVHHAEGGWRPSGDPMEAALVTLGHKAGLDPQAERRACPRVAEIPFDGGQQYMATCHDNGGEAPVVAVKGAPERVFAMLADGVELGRWQAQVRALASRGLRVLAIATGEAPPGAPFTAEAPPRGLRLLGLVGLIDPPRAAALAAVQECREAGIRIKMITGDHALTAGAIAAQLGLADAPRVVVGAELEGLSPEALAALARETDVFARTTPEAKLRLVEALQADGSVVAMTGDGVNDAPALKRADVGVAMGITGTEVAKEASQLVLADDNFASIVAAVREGRTVYDNITKVIAWTLPTNGGEVFAVVGAMALGVALPVSAVQILWINLVTAVALGLTLAWDPPKPDVMRRPPRSPRAPLLTRALALQTLLLCGLFGAGVAAVYAWMVQRGQGLEATRTAVVHTLVAMEIAYLYNVRSSPGGGVGLATLWATPAVRLGVAAVVGCQLLFTYAPPLQAMFHTRPLGPVDWLGPLVAGLWVWATVEVVHRWRRRGTLTPAR